MRGGRRRPRRHHPAGPRRGDRAPADPGGSWPTHEADARQLAGGCSPCSLAACSGAAATGPAPSADPARPGPDPRARQWARANRRRAPSVARRSRPSPPRSGPISSRITASTAICRAPPARPDDDGPRPQLRAAGRVCPGRSGGGVGGRAERRVGHEARARGLIDDLAAMAAAWETAGLIDRHRVRRIGPMPTRRRPSTAGSPGSALRRRSAGRAAGPLRAPARHGHRPDLTGMERSLRRLGGRVGGGSLDGRARLGVRLRHELPGRRPRRRPASATSRGTTAGSDARRRQRTARADATCAASWSGTPAR